MPFGTFLVRLEVGDGSDRSGKFSDVDGWPAKVRSTVGIVPKREIGREREEREGDRKSNRSRVADDDDDQGDNG